METVNFKTEVLAIQDELLRFAFKLTNDPKEANDLLQETTLRALDNENEFTGATNFRGWMYTIMRNIFINNYRKQVRDQTFINYADNPYSKDIAFDNTEATYDPKEIYRAVNRLPKEYRIPFSMHIAGFKYRDIAEKLNIPLGTVKSRIAFTRKRLQSELAELA